MQQTFIVLSLLLLSLGSRAESEFPVMPYDEMYVQPYEAGSPQVQMIESSDKCSGKKCLVVDPEWMNLFPDGPFNDCNRVFPFPLVLDDKDYARVQAGTRQIAQALSAFFEDIVQGPQHAIKRGGFIKEELLNAIVVEAGFPSLAFFRQKWASKSSNYINFILGPDLVRSPQGEWNVVEVNVSTHMGGMADLQDLTQLFSQVSNIKDPQWVKQADVIGMIVRNFCQAHKLRHEDLVFLGGPSEQLEQYQAGELQIPRGEPKPDTETLRVISQLEKLRVRTSDPHRWKQKELTEFLRNPPAAVWPHISRNVSFLSRSPRTFVDFDLFSQRQVQCLVAPGTDILSSKALLGTYHRSKTMSVCLYLWRKTGNSACSNIRDYSFHQKRATSFTRSRLQSYSSRLKLITALASDLL